MTTQLISNKLSFFALTFLIIFSSFQFIQIMRHKSGFLSDSYFYKHIYYEMKGNSFYSAKTKIQSQINFPQLDTITSNIFLRDNVYRDVYGYFIKRPLYPFLIATFSYFFSESTSMILPVFIAYLGSIILSYRLLRSRFNTIFTAIGVFLLINFYPFLDWSTYFLTDTIGFFFWLLQLVFVYKLFITQKKRWYLGFILVMIVSLFNREQSLVFFLTPIFAGIVMQISNKKRYLKNNLLVLGGSLFVTLIYTAISLFFHNKNLLDTITYTMNSYGLYKENFTTYEILIYITKSFVISHIFLAKDMFMHHLWLTITLFSILGFITVYKKIKLIDILMLSSALASYSALLFYPVLSYRYFFPVVLTICYFSVAFLMEILKLSWVENNTKNVE